MKFLVTKDTQASGLLRFLMGGLLAAVLLYLPMDILLHGLQLGFTPADVKATLYGDEAAFLEPILLDTLLLQVHIDLFMTLFVVLILSAMIVRLMERKQTKRVLLHLLGTTGLMMPMLLLSAYFFGSAVLHIWIGVFLFWHLVAFCVSIALLRKVVR